MVSPPFFQLIALILCPEKVSRTFINKTENISRPRAKLLWNLFHSIEIRKDKILRNPYVCNDLIFHGMQFRLNRLFKKKSN